MSRPFPVIILLFSTSIAGRADEPTKKNYVKSAVGKLAWIRAGIGSSINFARDVPREWGQSAAGFGKRYGSSLGQHAIKSTVQYTIAHYRHEAVGYERSTEDKFGPRLKHALLSTVITYKTTDGGKTVASGKIAGSFAGGLISRLWHPERVQTVSSGLTSGGVVLAVEAGTNVLREFWPDIRHPHRKRQPPTVLLGN
jgi:hypothetical protein